jgi:Domain of unknown function (DUF3336)
MLRPMTIGPEQPSNLTIWRVQRFVNSADIPGRNAWKDDPVSPDYDYSLLCRRLNQLRDARAAGDLTRVLFLLRISLTRNFARSGNPQVRHHVVDV